ncbi:atp-dependent nuclease, subunit a [hydrocarbon metagenome]|uniref:DNA 3'-5' helicase n=1 Tax=hydrocarbon metagenome TaxID=938273 RepID=A0A0W8E5L8_9ZZZZ
MSRWTKEQAQAIDSRNSNLLVAAAAGSGKTAVLVQRVIDLILRDHIDIDRLLIVTFTQAAAAEMRERINSAIFRELQEGKQDDQVHLRRQLNLLNQASISTIHSFCREVVKKYFFLVDIDPNFRVSDESESVLIKMDVMEELIETEYELGKAEFIQLVEMFGGSKSDGGLLDLIKQGYEFTQSQPDPEQWLRNSAAHFAVDQAQFADSVWLQEIARQGALQLAAARDILINSLRISEKPGGPEAYIDTLRNDIELLEDLIRGSEQGLEILHEKLHSLSFQTLKRAGKETDKHLKDRAQKQRMAARKLIEKLQKNIFLKHPNEYRSDLNSIHPFMEYLCDLILKFSALYRHKKNERNILDFNDLEHYALEILKDISAAGEYRKKYLQIFVDEYQDSNLVQETILAYIRRDDNLFMVGDIKQSIYRFRSADPSLFLGKYLTFGTGEGEIDQRIDLSKNFRSRAGILAGINYLFKNIMSRELGEIDYDENAMLYPGLGSDEAGDHETELIIVEKGMNAADPEDEIMSEIQELPDVALEARIAARRIKELAGSLLYDARTQEYRLVEYRDIVVLMRATRRWAAEFVEVFRSEGIPVYADSSSGYFDAAEVDLILNLLKIIDNRRQDIPLLSVMRSPIGGFDIDELSEIRLCLTRGTYFDAVENYIHSCSNSLAYKIKLFLEQLDQWREQSRLMPVDEFIYQLLFETGYYYYAASMPGGRQRQANLDVLVNRARQFQDSSIKGLFNFTRFIENIKSSSGDLDPARVLGENDNVIRIMSIHKSKGLEFPVVIVAGLGKRFNEADTRGNILFHSRLGLGPRLIRTDLRTKTDTIARIAMQNRIKVENLSEEMRILYVAMTRAQSKLILLGSLRGMEKEAQKWCGISNVYELLRARTFLDWIGPALAHHAGVDTLRAMVGETADGIAVHEDVSRWQITTFSRSDLQVEESRKMEFKQEFKEKLQNHQADCGREEIREISQRLDWQYPYQHAVLIPSKLSVSQIKQMGIREVIPSTTRIINNAGEEPEFIPARHDFGLSPLEKGNLVHLVMEHIEFKPYEDLAEVEEQISLMLQKELLTEREAELLDKTNIFRFFTSSLGKRAIAAERMYRETAFIRVCSAQEIITGADGIDEQLLIQGVIDLFFLEGNEAILIDYKTDLLTPANRQERIDLYQLQLQEYQKAIEQIGRIPVKESYLYFFDSGETVKIV